MFLMLTSSKGISSVVMARFLGKNQKTVWKMGHAIREVTDDRNGELLPLADIVEIDDAFVGGAPKSLSGACNLPGNGCGKPRLILPRESGRGHAAMRSMSAGER